MSRWPLPARRPRRSSRRASPLSRSGVGVGGRSGLAPGVPADCHWSTARNGPSYLTVPRASKVVRKSATRRSQSASVSGRSNSTVRPTPIGRPMNRRRAGRPAWSNDRAASEIDSGEMPTSRPMSCSAARVSPCPRPALAKRYAPSPMPARRWQPPLRHCTAAHSLSNHSHRGGCASQWIGAALSITSSGATSHPPLPDQLSDSSGRCAARRTPPPASSAPAGRRGQGGVAGVRCRARARRRRGASAQHHHAGERVERAKNRRESMHRLLPWRLGRRSWHASPF